MSGKSKFQISRTLEDRIKNIAISDSEHEFASVSKGYILGFHSGNVTNYVGLTTNYKLFHAALQIVGIVFFRDSPESESDIANDLKSVIEFSNSSDGIGSYKQDKNEHLFIVYTFNTETSLMEKKIFDSSSSSYATEQPKLSVLDESKIYNHSSIVKLNVCIKVLNNNDNIISEAKKIFANDSKSIKMILSKSNFSANTSADNKNSTESLYDNLDSPDDLEQMGDYLPQMTKKDKEKLLEKWRNKVKSQRAPLELTLDLGDISLQPDDSCPSDCHKLNLESYFYLHMNDSLSKSMKSILFMLRNRLDLLKFHLGSDESILGGNNQVKSCTFKPNQVGHLIPTMYIIPDGGVKKQSPDNNRLLDFRRELHSAYLLTKSRPLLRYGQRILNKELKNEQELDGYLCNVHTSILDNSGIKGGCRNIVDETYTYHHYMQHRASDNGWGCAYRSLQTIISWFMHQGYIYSPDVELREPVGGNKGEDKTKLLREKLHLERRVPTHDEIQSVLVDVGDKQPSFIGSQKWIGSQEVCYVLNHLYNLDSKFISVSSGSELVYKARDLGQHFSSQRTPVMIGGGVLAHTIIGLDFNDKNGDISFLILDPHYTGGEDLGVITKKGWCGWKKNSFWDKNAFYNLCLPQAPQEI